MHLRPRIQSLQEYQGFVVKQLRRHYIDTPSYRGAPPRDPADLLRCWLCMTLAGYTSVSDWVIAMRTVPLLAILCGFAPDDTPGVGTLYNFQHR